MHGSVRKTFILRPVLWVVPPFTSPCLIPILGHDALDFWVLTGIHVFLLFCGDIVFLDISCTFTSFFLHVCRHANLTGAPIMRPLWYHYPHTPETFGVEDEFMLGPGMLVVPVMEVRWGRVG